MATWRHQKFGHCCQNYQVWKSIEKLWRKILSLILPGWEIDLWNEWDPIIFHFSKQMMTLSAIRTIHPLKFPLLMWQQKHCIDIEAAWLPEVDFIALSSLLLQAWLFSCSDRCKVVGNGLHLSIPSRIIWHPLFFKGKKPILKAYF